MLLTRAGGVALVGTAGGASVLLFLPVLLAAVGLLLSPLDSNLLSAISCIVFDPSHESMPSFSLFLLESLLLRDNN